MMDWIVSFLLSFLLCVVHSLSNAENLTSQVPLRDLYVHAGQGQFLEAASFGQRLDQFVTTDTCLQAVSCARSVFLYVRIRC